MHTLIHSSFQMSTLLTLPNELIIQILQKLAFLELAAVRKTCKLLRELTLDDVVMRNVAKATQQQWNTTLRKQSATSNQQDQYSTPIENWPSGGQVCSMAELIRIGHAEAITLLDLQRQIQDRWSSKKGWHDPSQAEIECVTALVNTGYVIDIPELRLRTITVPRNIGQGKLINLVTGELLLSKMRIYKKKIPKVSLILKNVRCTELRLHEMALSTEDSAQLAELLKDHVIKLEIGYSVSLDLPKLLEYEGRGKCAMITYRRTQGSRIKRPKNYSCSDYTAQLTEWCKKIGWSHKKLVQLPEYPTCYMHGIRLTSPTVDLPGIMGLPRRLEPMWGHCHILL